MNAGTINELVQAHVARPELRRMTLSGVRPGRSMAFRRATIRPVEVRGRRHLQVVTYDQRRSLTKIVADGTSGLVAELSVAPFRFAVIELVGLVIEARVTKKGLLVTSQTSVPPARVDLSHDRYKSQPIAEDAPFLEVLGISRGGRVKPSRHAKYRQINEFIRLLVDAPGTQSMLDAGRVHIVDFGCGNAYLTFAVFHHLTELGMACEVTGVDRNAELIDRNQKRAERLAWESVAFRLGDIAAYEPESPPEVVIALHACDTASDHALSAAVHWDAGVALVAPCCHHDLQVKLADAQLEPAERVLLRHGLLRERLGDVITDAARALIMRLVGYDVDVVEFVSPEHTARNVLLRCSRLSQPPPSHLVEAYTALTARWSVEPLLAGLLRDRMPGLG